jgi:hypothetical protein
MSDQDELAALGAALEELLHRGYRLCPFPVGGDLDITFSRRNGPVIDVLILARFGYATILRAEALYDPRFPFVHGREVWRYNHMSPLEAVRFVLGLAPTGEEPDEQRRQAPPSWPPTTGRPPAAQPHEQRWTEPEDHE